MGRVVVRPWAVGAPAAAWRPRNRPPGRPSAGTQWDGTGGPSARGSWLSGLHVSARLPGSAPPFPARCRAVRLDSRGVDQHVSRWAARLSQGVEETSPHTLGGPADEAVVEGLLGPIHGWCIHPPSAGLQHVHDAADHPPIINPRLAARVGGRWGAIFANCASVSQN